ncbi:helix-turn-helix transcriptional regulator [Sedimentitalea todarodis]|uniref:Helix-turn-helix transcriptional regulator n=1 Tax=Sedimentitalea todarodis TaxID=1631240 RepID=A0ABU3VLW7_9RHOB|nr:helix-turn-helix transcriptional regulator [Sedimentitalea todarodis]MDU9007193.1 helix-turn-helix transcriptional regulator [Sedimentitalea todarodis]
MSQRYERGSIIQLLMPYASRCVQFHVTVNHCRANGIIHLGYAVQKVGVYHVPNSWWLGRMNTQDLDFTLKIYDAVADPIAWQPVLDEVVDRTKAHGSIVFEWNETGGSRHLTAPLHSGRYPASLLSLYLDKCAHLEERDQDIVRKHTADYDAVELLDDTLIASTSEELRRSEHVKFLESIGIFHRAAGVMNKDNRWISLFSLQLGAGRPQLSDQERSFLSPQLPHLAKALDLSIPFRQLHQRYKAVLSAMDQLTIGLCVLDQRGLIVARNEEFQRQQEAYRSLRVGADGRLLLGSANANKRLSDLMEHATRHGQFGARPRKESILSNPTDALCVEVSPLHNASEMGSATFDGFLICSTDTSLPMLCNVERVGAAFGLTNTETALVEPIAQGLTNPEIADRRERAVATINVQIKAILSKSGCANRTQFVRAMMRFGTQFLRDDAPKKE